MHYQVDFKIKGDATVQKRKVEIMKKVKVADGEVEIREKKYHYEFYSDNENVFVKIYHPGKNGDVTQFQRNDKINLKADMDNALENNGMFK